MKNIVNDSSSSRIAKNTLFLYFRMLILMAVSLYTSRVVLDKLGIDDYGLYNVVGGVVGMLSFLNGTLSNGTSRFLTYELGRGDTQKLQRTFTTAFYTHTALAGVIVVAMETVGLWFLYNRLVIPTDRFDACFWVFQLSILTSVISITQTPYTASIMSHERMGVYAYVSILEGVAKLAICYLLTITEFDRLVFYAVLIVCVQFVVSSTYRLYCVSHFDECRLRGKADKKILRGMMEFSGWNIMANLSETLNVHGVLLILNLFFAPAVVASQAVASQVSNTLMQFVNNFRTAINPQIIKLYAAGDKEESKKLTLNSTIYCFDLLLMLGLPAIIVMDKVMDLWLVEVPEYAVVFVQWIIVRRLVSTFSASFYIPMMAANKMKVNSIAAAITSSAEFVALYILFRQGLGPLWIQYIGLLTGLIFSLVVKPYVLCKDIGYSLNEIARCVFTCAKVAIASCAAVLPVVFLWTSNSIVPTIVKALIALLSVSVSAYLFLDANMKVKLRTFVIQKLHHS